MQELMTKRDAIEYLLYMKHHVQANSPMDIALDTAIEALKHPTIEPEVRHGRHGMMDMDAAKSILIDKLIHIRQNNESMYRGLASCTIVLGITDHEFRDIMDAAIFYLMHKDDSEKVRHGRWIVNTTWHGMFGLIHSECSECKFDRNGDLSSWQFCPHCGARMDGGADNAESD